VRGVEELIVTPRKIVTLGGRSIEQFRVTMYIASEPLVDDGDYSTVMLTVVLVFYFLFWPIFQFVIKRFCKYFGYHKAEKLPAD
jgi:hypothetical protein